MDSVESEVEREPMGRVRPPRDPYRRDPLMESQEEVALFLDTCDLKKVELEPKQAMKNICTCKQCCVMELVTTANGTYEHLCCQQSKHWKEKFSDSEVSCVTEHSVFSGVTNDHAVRNLLMLSWAYNKEKTVNAGQVICNPPSNQNMRFGNYKAPFTFIELLDNLV